MHEVGRGPRTTYLLRHVSGNRLPGSVLFSLGFFQNIGVLHNPVASNNSLQ